jgi:CRP-like cAMP-binding protein
MSILLKLIKATIPNSHYQIFRRGEVVYRESDESKNVWLIDSGLVGLFYISETGRETFLRVFGENYIFGHRSLVVSENYHASAVALTTSRIAHLPREDFLRILKNSNEALFELTQIVARDLRKAEKRISGMMDKSAAKRVIETILYLQLRYPDQPWTRKEIAEFSETTLETTARVLAQLEVGNFITKNGRRFSINDPESLLGHSYQL